MILINQVIGQVHDSKISSLLQELTHQNKVEYIVLDHINLQRRRFRTKTDKGTDCAISISRNYKLSNGSVLLLETNRAIVIKMKENQWLSLKPHNITTAIELGYFAGNMHWRVRFCKGRLDIALDSPEYIYLERLQNFFNEKKITLLNEN